MKKSSELLLFFLFFATVYAAEYILRSVYHFEGNDPIYRRVGMCVATIFWLGYMFYLWRSDINGFFKRGLIAVPFALIFAIFMILVNGSLFSAAFGLPMYLFLIVKTSSWKQHFSVTLLVASICTIISKFSAIINPYIPQEISIYQILFPVINMLFFGFFYSLYMRKVIDGETIDLRAILIRILKFSGAFSLYFASWLTLDVFSKHYQISLLINLTISSAITIAFLMICHLFDLMPVERKKKKNRISEIQNELNEFYLEECRKIKRSQ